MNFLRSDLIDLQMFYCRIWRPVSIFDKEIYVIFGSSLVSRMERKKKIYTDGYDHSPHFQKSYVGRDFDGAVGTKEESNFVLKSAADSFWKRFSKNWDESFFLKSLVAAGRIYFNAI